MNESAGADEAESVTVDVGANVVVKPLVKAELAAEDEMGGVDTVAVNDGTGINIGSDEDGPPNVPLPEVELDIEEVSESQ